MRTLCLSGTVELADRSRESGGTAGGEQDPVVRRCGAVSGVHGQCERCAISPSRDDWKPAPETNSIAVLVVHTPRFRAEDCASR